MKLKGPEQPTTKGPGVAVAPAAAAGAPAIGRVDPASAPWASAGPVATRVAEPSHRPRLTFDAPGFQARLDRETNSRAVAGNTITPLYDGVESFAERDRLIDGAKHSICLQTFIFDSDETGWALARKLAEKAKAGVTVRLVVDKLGSHRADPAMFELMRAAGVEVREYGAAWQVWDLNERWHEKNLVVDGQVAVLGGMNIADEYRLGGTATPVKTRKGAEGWRDVDVKLEGPIVRDAAEAFIRNWERLGPKLTDGERMRLFPPLVARPSGPTARIVQQNPVVPGRVDSAYRLHVLAIEAAEKRISIETAYFLPPPEVRRALIDAAKRGVEVNVITNSNKASDFPIASEAARYFYDELLAAGVKVFESDVMIHSKTATFDGRFSIIGSLNLNGRSKHLDTEIVMATDDRTVAESLEKRFGKSLARTLPVKSMALARESMMRNLMQWTLSTFAWTM